MALLVAAATACAAPAHSRLAAARAEFVKGNPCPATKMPKGACPGWQVDHRVALCAGGDDAPHNMQWLTVEAHRVKTRQDVRQCRAQKARQ